MNVSADQSSIAAGNTSQVIENTGAVLPVACVSFSTDQQVCALLMVLSIW